jgi:hypothetical protein
MLFLDAVYLATRLAADRSLPPPGSKRKRIAKASSLKSEVQLFHSGCGIGAYRRMTIVQI